MAKRGRRYDDGAKLNLKKVFAVAVGFLLIIALIIGITQLLNKDTKSIAGKIENMYYYTIYDNGKWGVINSYGEIVVKATYDEMIIIPDEAQDLFICTYDVNYSDGTYKTKVINAKGKEIIKDYDITEAIANYDKNQNIWYEKNVFRVKKDGKFGLINYSGKKLLSCEYNNINPVNGIENSLIIEKDGKVGLCDDSGNIIIEPNYKRIDKINDDYKNGYIVVDENDKYGIIGFDKSVILENRYDEIKGLSGENIYVIKDNGKYSIVNKSGEKILDKQFDDIEEIDKEYIVAVQNGKRGVVNIQGDTKIDFKYDYLAYTKGDFYIAKNGDKYGVVSINGDIKLPIESTSINYVSSGDFIIADYLENGKFISKIYDGNYDEKITGIVSEINDSKGYIRVYTNSEYKYYNFKFEEKSASQLLTANKLFLSKNNGKYGFVDASGNVVIDYIYDDATEQNNSGYAAIKKDGVWGAIDLNGNVVVEPKYNLDNNSKIDFVGTWHLCEDTNANYYLDA